MFTCQACLRRGFTLLARHAPRPGNNTLATIRPIYASIQSRRRHRTYATAAATAETVEQETTRNNTTTRKTPRIPESREWAAQKQLQYLKDPLHIADYVNRTLGKGNFEEAALVARKASKDTKVVVSWNNLIDYQLRQGKLHAAIKLYQEMKKRAQSPNAQTFTIIFRGLAASPHPKLAVSEAIKIYNNMLASASRIKPNTIHMNAVLQVCAKAEDIEALFTIIDSANETLRAPNNQTYTTILNALRSTINKPHHETLQDLETEKTKAQTIQRAKAVWGDVISKWSAGSIIVDEELVCAMGRILLMGGYHDANSVEELIQQTMIIQPYDKAVIPGLSKEAAGLNESDANAKPPVSVATNKIKAPGAPAISHALPGRNSLSMILLALEKTGKTARAERYWDIFTKQHGVVPDANNWHQLFATLRRGKNSFKTVSYLRDIPPELTVPKNFRTAMNTCLRDNLNRSSFAHATEVLEIMMAKLLTPDMNVLRSYLQVAYANKRNAMEHSKDEAAAMATWGKQLAMALDHLWKPYLMLSRQYEKDGPESNSKQQLVALARKMIAACDRIIFGKMVPEEVEEQIKPRRNGLNRVVVRHFEQMREIDPNFREEDLNEKPEDEDDYNGFTKQFQPKRDAKTPGKEKRPSSERW